MFSSRGDTSQPPRSTRLHALGVGEFTSLVLDRDKVEKVPSREERRRQQETYRQDLALQITDDRGRRERERKILQKLERQHELKSAIYNPWGKPGSGAPLRHPNGELVTNVKAYFRAKQQGLIAQDLSPNEIAEGEEPFAFTLAGSQGSPTQRSAGPRTSRSTGSVVGSSVPTNGRTLESAVSLSPPRSRYRFDRLPPEEQSDLDRRKKERSELQEEALSSLAVQAALWSQLEEKRLQRQKEAEVKRAEDDSERREVLRALADERAENQGRRRPGHEVHIDDPKASLGLPPPTVPQQICTPIPPLRDDRVRDKNLRGGDPPQTASLSRLCHPFMPEHYCSAADARRQVACAPQDGPHALRQGRNLHTTADRTVFHMSDLNDGDYGQIRQEKHIRDRAVGINDMDRQGVLLALRILEEHGKMLAELASELQVLRRGDVGLAGQMTPRIAYPNKPERDCKRGHPPALEGLNSYRSALPRRRIAASSLSPIFRTFQQDEDQLDRLLQHFDHRDHQLRREDDEGFDVLEELQ